MKDQNVGRLARSRSTQDRLKANSNLNIQYRRIDTLRPDPANPRRHSEKQLKQIAEIIKRADSDKKVKLVFAKFGVERSER